MSSASASFLPLLSYDDDAPPAAPPAAPTTAPSSAAAAATVASGSQRTVPVPPAPPGSNVTGVDSTLLETVLRRFTAVDFNAEPPSGSASGAAANPTAQPTSRAAAPPTAAATAAGVKPALKKKAACAPPRDPAVVAAEAEEKARLAAEAAARRAAAEATLRAKQARAAAALAAVEWMLEHNATSEEELRTHALGPLTASEFGEAMQERVLAGTCGNPLCAKPITCVYRGAAPCIHAGAALRERCTDMLRCALVLQGAQGCRPPARVAQPAQGVPLAGAAVLLRHMRRACARHPGVTPGGGTSARVQAACSFYGVSCGRSTELSGSDSYRRAGGAACGKRRRWRGDHGGPHRGARRATTRCWLGGLAGDAGGCCACGLGRGRLCAARSSGADSGGSRAYVHAC